MNKRLVLWCAIAFIAAISVLLLFPLLGMQRSGYFSTRTAWCVAILVCQIGAVWYFLVGTGFKRELRIAYVLLSIGILCMGIAQVQLVVLTYIDGWRSFYAASGLALLPYLATSALTYASMRQLARIMGLRLLGTNLFFVALFSLSGTATAIALFWSSQNSFASSGYDALLGWSIAMGLATISIAYQVKSSLSPTFGKAMNWLIASFIITIGAGIHQLWLQHFTSQEWWYREQGWSVWLLLVASMFFLKAGSEFRQLTQGLAANAKPLDVVMYVVGLVSRPSDIEPSLDRLRVLTASIKTGESLNEHQQLELANIYQRIEHYLTTRELLRTFTKSSLRARLPEEFLSWLQNFER